MHSQQSVHILALNSTHIIPEVTNLISTFVWVLLTGDVVEVHSVHVSVRISYANAFTASVHLS